MIPASLYLTIYLLIVLFFTMRTIPLYTRSVVVNIERTKTAQKGLALILVVFMVFFIGLRPVSGKYFLDMANYQDYWNAANAGTFIFVINNYIWDPLFVALAVSGMPIDVFFTLVALVYFGGIYVACKKMFPHDTLLAFLVYLAGFSTFSYSTNGIKAGVAAALFLVAVAYKEKRILLIILLVVILGVHHSMIVPITAVIAAHFVKNKKLYLFFWLACFLMAVLHITALMSFLGGFADDHGADYLQEGESVSGFRPDFILYSAIPIFLGYFLTNKYKLKSSYYDFLWNVYTLTNSVFLICTYGTFINRIAYLSWLMYPIVLIYPFLNIVWSKKQDKYLKYAVWGHLGFTLFMFFIYYG